MGKIYQDLELIKSQDFTSLSMEKIFDLFNFAVKEFSDTNYSSSIRDFLRKGCQILDKEIKSRHLSTEQLLDLAGKNLAIATSIIAFIFLNNTDIDPVINFIKTSQFLRELNLNYFYIGRSLKQNEIHAIFNALQHNTSIKILNFNGQLIEDENFNILLQSLATNPYIKVAELHLAKTGLSDESADALINFLRIHPSLITIKLTLDVYSLENVLKENKISEKHLKHIDELIEKQKLNFATRAIFGLFKPFNFPVPACEEIANDLEFSTAKKVALTTKLAAEEANKKLQNKVFSEAKISKSLKNIL